MPHHPSFLGLPSDIRLKIYIFAGLVRVCPISINYEGSRRTYRESCLAAHAKKPSQNSRGKWTRVEKVHCEFWWKSFNLDLYPGFYNEFAGCRMLFEALYSRNKFRLLLDGGHKLSAEAVDKMLSLSVRLNTCSCISNHFCRNPKIYRQCERCHEKCLRGGDLPLSDKSDLDGNRVDRWNDFCKVLGKALRPEMRLSVICDCVDAAAAKQIVQPVQCFPKLAGCAIRLGQSPAVDLRQLAEDTVLKLTHHMPVARSKPFRFLHLPRESQRRILWYTDLASVCALEWHNTYRVRPVRRIKQLGELKEGYCMRCTDAGESFCCAVNHAAYSSAPCDCWRFPLSFFLVSKEFNKEATELFFSVNKFVVLDQSSSEDSCVPINLFQLLPFGALRHLRWIRVVCSAFGWDLSQEAGEELAIWRKMAQYIARYLDTSKLTVELICDCHSDDMEPKQIWNRLQDMVGVFRFKNPPKDSLLYLHRVSHQIYAKTLEKQVMGPDYNARARGKHTDRDYSLTEVLVKRGPVYGPDGSIIHRWD